MYLGVPELPLDHDAFQGRVLKREDVMDSIFHETAVYRAEDEWRFSARAMRAKANYQSDEFGNA